MILDELRTTKYFSSSYANRYFTSFMNKLYNLLDNKIHNINIHVSRRNNDLVFFNKLSKEASIKKILEVEQTLNSINRTYNIELSSN